MTFVDIGILIGFVFFAVLGFRDGFFRKVYAVLGFWGGLILATKFMKPVGKSFIKVLETGPELSFILAFFLIFSIFVILENLLYRWFGSSALDSRTMWSRVGGLLIGSLQGFVAISLILIMLRIIDIPQQSTRRESLLYPQFIKVAPALFDKTISWLPEREFIEELKDNFSGKELDVP